MANLNVIGGDFAKRAGWFYPTFGFVLRDQVGHNERISTANLAVAEHGVIEAADAIRALGGDDAMIDGIEQLPLADRAGAFVALFADGRLLLATTDPVTCAAICTGRGRNPA